MTTILVVEDEPRIAAVVADYLQHDGHQVSIAGTGAAALERARAVPPDLVVLDLGLPDMDGVEVARALRRHTLVPIVMLTARSDEADRLAGFDLGADDYVVKPFSPRELVARIRAVLRRNDAVLAAGRRSERFTAGDVVVDPTRSCATVGTRVTELTPTELDLLVALARSPGRVFTRDALLAIVRGDLADTGSDQERVIDSHVKNLRRKLEDDPRHPTRILTVHGVGYRFAGP